MAPDGKTAMGEFTDNQGTGHDTGKVVWRRLGKGAKGSNAVAGSWRLDHVESASGNGFDPNHDDLSGWQDHENGHPRHAEWRHDGDGARQAIEWEQCVPPMAGRRKIPFSDLSFRGSAGSQCRTGRHGVYLPAKR